MRLGQQAVAREEGERDDEQEREARDAHGGPEEHPGSEAWAHRDRPVEQRIDAQRQRGRRADRAR